MDNAEYTEICRIKYGNMIKYICIIPEPGVVLDLETVKMAGKYHTE